MICNSTKELDSGFRRNDRKRPFLTFYEAVKTHKKSFYQGMAWFAAKTTCPPFFFAGPLSTLRMMLADSIIALLNLYRLSWLFLLKPKI